MALLTTRSDVIVQSLRRSKISRAGEHGRGNAATDAARTAGDNGNVPVHFQRNLSRVQD
jgi:hypothetical protein